MRRNITYAPRNHAWRKQPRFTLLEHAGGMLAAALIAFIFVLSILQ